MKKSGITRTRLALVASIVCLHACTFSNSLHQGDYVQQRKPSRPDVRAAKGEFYVTCTSYARHYDQVVKTVGCQELWLLSIMDQSVQQEILGNFHSLSFNDPLGTVNAKRPEQLDGVKQVVHLHINQEYGWPRYTFQALFSALTLTLLPLDYPREYTLTLSLENPDGTIVRKASRQVNMDNWWWMPLMFAYPFYNEKRASENILLNTGRELVHELDP